MEYTNKVCCQGSANENRTVVGVIDFKLELECVDCLVTQGLFKVERTVDEVICVKDE